MRPPTAITPIGTIFDMLVKFVGTHRVGKHLLHALLVLLIAFWAWRPTGAEPPDDTFFESNIRPLLIEHCVSCHGEKKQEAGLRVDSLAGMLTGGDSGPALVPGATAQSRIIQAVRRQDGLEMPPNKPLTEPAMQLLEQWVRSGAYWPAKDTPSPPAMKDRRSHWAFQPVVDPAVPASAEPSPGQNAVDAFVRDRLRQHELVPAPLADRRTLIRRATYALTGLPPSERAVQQFVNDELPQAFERLVDALLKSPHYGEKWARHWLDVARYSDTKGYVYAREERFWTQAWTYRDWVVQALNADMPYDRFLLLQIAADQIADRQPGDLAAMGFMTLGRRFLGVRRDIIDDRIDVVTRGTMGLTVGCARCHDHKYDPIPTDDYYSLYGVFDSCVESQVILDATEADDAFRAELEKRQRALEEKLTAASQAAYDRCRERLSDYLFAQTELHKFPADGFDQVFEKTDLLPAFVRQWERYLRDAQLSGEPIFALWHAYYQLPSETFADEAASVLPTLQRAGAALQPQLVEAFTAAPVSMRDVCDRYAAVLEEAIDAELRAVLHAEDSPCRVPAGPVSHCEFYFDSGTLNELWKLQGEVDRWLVNASAPVKVAVALVDQATPSEPRIFRRGDPLKLGDDVPRRFLELLSGSEREPFQTGSGRLELAQAIVDPSNPLTARVLVNRVWAHHFGTGLVSTPSDFGVRASAPSHPELLDWLTSRFIEDGWSIKKLHRRILLSETYQQSSAPPEDEALLARCLAVDPDNRLLWRMPPHRLTFEELRDTLLQVTGTLDLKFGGRPASLFNEPFMPRRTLYGLVDRQYFPATMRAFDFANPDLHIPQRNETTVPQQALFFLNHPFVLEQARTLAAATRDAGSPKAQVQAMFRQAYQREATTAEIADALALINAHPSSTLAHTSNSAASSEEPSAKAWSYGYGSVDEASQQVASFTPLPYFTGTAWQGSAAWPDAALGWVQLTAAGGHPGNDRAHAAIRRWTAPRDITVTITSHVNHEPQVGDGIRCFIFQGGDNQLGSINVHHDQADLNIGPIDLKQGETLDFIVDINNVLNSDQYLWQVKIAEHNSIQDIAIQWDSHDDFTTDQTLQLDTWEQLAQVLLCSNELLFVD
ncbi:MAG: PSD1 and planctomycete cytochrome C domain-containing protein [Pirellulaceae bacterium]